MKDWLKLLGWIFFLVCGLLWIGIAAFEDDMMGLIIGLLWIVGCVIFIADLFINNNNQN